MPEERVLMEIRVHGRGGQGSVTASELIAVAAISEGKYAQAIPSFGPERRGAPVVAFTRISDDKIWERTAIYNPDVVVVLDPSLIKVVNVAGGLKSGGTIVANTKLTPAELQKQVGANVKYATVDATTIALKELGAPIFNTPMLGAFSKATGLVRLESLIQAAKEKFPGAAGERNAKAIERAYDETRMVGG